MAQSARADRRRQPVCNSEFTFHHLACGEVILTDLVVCTPSEWERDPRSNDKAWCISESTVCGRKVTLAVRVHLPVGTTAKLLDAYARFNAECIARECKTLPTDKTGKKGV